jgi:ABC-type branched-subunit amino acid transport system ATPase component
VRLEVSGVESGYGSATVLRGVDLAVADGEAVAVVGRNGMGKTTLLRTILGYLTPTAGSISLDGHRITGMLPERIVRRGVAYGPQDEPVFAELTVEDNLVAAARRRIEPSRRSVVLEYFPVLGQRLRQRAGTLSGGELKMLVLARALLASPVMIVLDEITSGLQPSVVDTVIRALRWERESRGTTLLLVEQNIDASLAICDRTMVLKRGRFIAGTSAEPDLDRAHARDELLSLLAP